MENGLKADVIIEHLRRRRLNEEGTFLELFVSGFELLDFRFFK